MWSMEGGLQVHGSDFTKNLLSIFVEKLDDVFGLLLLVFDLIADLGVEVFFDVQDLGRPEERAALDPNDGGRGERHCSRGPRRSIGRAESC